ncbi:hypothetical protein [Pseudochrobactrum sp. MP213Fo]|uniref:hypothetical protein n=1 Tax=Pseudochrobactrum sp. MP213Fo TaxID=3022250 RepID=UPI003BA2640E
MSVFFDYKKSIKTADGLISKFGNGKLITITRLSAGTGPTHNAGPMRRTLYQAKGVVLPASKGTIEAFDIKLGDNLITQNVRFCIMSAKMRKISGDGPDTITPEPTDLLEFNGLKLTVLGCTPLAPAGIPVYFPMGARV